MSQTRAKVSGKRIGASIFGGVVLCAAAATAWYFWRQPLPAPDAPPSVLAKFASGKQFAEMHYSEQQPYVDVLEHMNIFALKKAADDAQMTMDERIDAIRNVINSRQERVMAEYYQIPAGAQRVAYMDKIIDEIERSPIRPNGTGPTINKVAAAEQKRHDDMTPPGRQMQVMQFYVDMLDRREQRGLKNATSFPKR